jgi:hypothetical protein
MSALYLLVQKACRLSAEVGASFAPVQPREADEDVIGKLMLDFAG